MLVLLVVALSIIFFALVETFRSVHQHYSIGAISLNSRNMSRNKPSSSNELDDSSVLFMLRSCDSYATGQLKLSNYLSSGIFQLTQAKKNGITLSANDVREDIDPCIALTNSTADGSFALDVVSDQKDALLMFSGLPPPALKRAQTHFKEAVKSIVELANIAAAINSRQHDS